MAALRRLATAVAAMGFASVVVDLPLHDPTDYPQVDESLARIVADVRRDPRIDGNRVALWAFSGGGMLAARWLAGGRSWVRGVALSYPLLGALPGWTMSAHSPSDALTAGGPPVLLTRVGRERPEIAATQRLFVDRAVDLGVPLAVIDVPEGRHTFDALDHTDASRRAVRDALDQVGRWLSP